MSTFFLPGNPHINHSDRSSRIALLKLRQAVANTKFGMQPHSQKPDSFECKDLKILMPKWLTASEQKIHRTHLLEALQYVQDSQESSPNLSGRHYGAKVILNNEVQALGTNIEASRQTTLCDLRNAIIKALSQPLPALHDRFDSKNTPMVKTVYLVNANLDAEAPIPCSDCQEWLNSRFCSPDTQVIFLEKVPKGKEAVARFRTVGEMLPLHKGREPVQLVTKKPIADLLIDPSPSAQAVLQSSNGTLSNDTLRSLLERAQTEYVQNEFGAAHTKQKTGVCMLLSPLGNMASGGRFEWSNRWFEPADLSTAVQAFKQAEGTQRLIRWVTECRCLPTVIQRRLLPLLETPKIQAVAYYGDDSNLPPLPSLGRIARERGSSDTVIVMVENDRIQVRTIADFMPEMYHTKKSAPSAIDCNESERSLFCV